MRTYRYDRLVGLSTEKDPQSLSRTECPDLQNVEVDRGGLVTTRAGYKRLSSSSFKDSCWKLRGSPYNASLFHDYYDALIIPHHSRYIPADYDFFVSCLVEMTLNGLGLGPTSGNEYPIIAKGTSADLKLYIYIEDTSGSWRWHAKLKDDGGTTHDFTVADADLNSNWFGERRFIEFGNADGDTVYYFKVTDADAGTAIGSATVDISPAEPSLGTADILIGAYPGSNGKPSVTSGKGYTAMKISNIFWQTDTNDPFVWTANSDFASRELYPSEYSQSHVKGYWKCNDADPSILRDYCDTADSDYTGSLTPNHGLVYNTGPQWLDKGNTVFVDASQNGDVANYTGVDLLNDYGLLFNGYDGIAMARSGSLDNTLTNDPLNVVFAQTAGSGVGWTVDVIWTPLLRPGQTAFPDTILYASRHGGGSSLRNNPISMRVSSDQFVLEFHDGTSTNTITLTTYNVSDFAGEMVTMTAVRDNQTLRFKITGQNKSMEDTTATAATSPSISGSANIGPWVMLMRQVDTFENSVSDDPATYTGTSAYGVLHEFRLWSRPHSPVEIAKYANTTAPIGGRNDLPIYLIPGRGYGNQLSNLGTSVNLTYPGSSGSPPVTVNAYMDTKLVPPQESGPVATAGMVTPYRPVPVKGAIDFRTNVGETVSRKLFFIAGATPYTFDLATNTLTAHEGNIRKRDRQFSMAVFAGNVYFANGDRPRVFDGSEVRWAGIEPPIKRARVTGNTTSGGTLADGSYFAAYRFVNTKTGYVSNLSPLIKFTTAGGGTSLITGLTNLETPHDPQVNAIDIFFTDEGGGSTLYWYDQTDDITSGTYAPAGGITSLTTASDLDVTRAIALPDLTAATPTIGDIYRFGAPPPSNAVAVMGSRMLYAARHEPGQVYFSRVDGGPQIEHVNITPGASAKISVETDEGDEVQALVPYNDSTIAYLRDARAEISFNSIDIDDAVGFEIPFQVQFLDISRGIVSPNAAINVLTEHAFMSEGDVYVRSRTEDRNLSSPPEDVTNASRPKIGRTIREQLANDYLRNTVAMHRQSRKQLWFAVTSEATTRNDWILVYSYADRKWTKYVMPWVDYIIEAESDGDRRIPIGFVNGYVCQLDETGVEVDGYDSDLQAVYTYTVSSVSGSAITLTGDFSGDGFTPLHRAAWVSTSSGIYPVVCLTPGTLTFTVDLLGNSAPANGDSISFGAVYPWITLGFNPSGELHGSRIQTIDVAHGHGGSTAISADLWVDVIDRDPALSTATIVGNTIAVASRDQQFSRGDMGEFGRFMLVRLRAVQAMSIQSIGIHFDPARSAKQYG